MLHSPYCRKFFADEFFPSGLPLTLHEVLFLPHPNVKDHKGALGTWYIRTRQYQVLQTFALNPALECLGRFLTYRQCKKKII